MFPRVGEGGVAPPLSAAKPAHAAQRKKAPARAAGRHPGHTHPTRLTRPPPAPPQGVPVPGMTASLGYFDTYRRARLPANLVQVCWGFTPRWPVCGARPVWARTPHQIVRSSSPRCTCAPHVPGRTPASFAPNTHTHTQTHTHAIPTLTHTQSHTLTISPLQAQRDFFGSHTYQRDDTGDAWHHSLWDPNFSSSDSITTGNYNA